MYGMTVQKYIPYHIIIGQNYYFVDHDIEGIIKKLEAGREVVTYVTELMELEGGQRLVRFYDPSGNLIEVRTPVNYKE